MNIYNILMTIQLVSNHLVKKKFSYLFTCGLNVTLQKKREQGLPTFDLDREMVRLTTSATDLSDRHQQQVGIVGGGGKGGRQYNFIYPCKGNYTVTCKNRYKIYLNRT